MRRLNDNNNDGDNNNDDDNDNKNHNDDDDNNDNKNYNDDDDKDDLSANRILWSEKETILAHLFFNFCSLSYAGFSMHSQTSEQ